MSEQLYCSLCGWPGVIWRNQKTNPYSYCPHCSGRNCLIEEIGEEEDDDEDEVIVVEVAHICQGRSRCELSAEEAEVAQVNGCVWCNRIVIYSDGTEEVKGPVDT